ncbi:MAG: imidazole glycerol phosphate synthase subunit HisH [Steroidobacteraceae bacterium]
MTVVGRNRTVGIVNYQAGNIHSIDSAFSCLGANTVRIRAVADFAVCTHVVLPGVGAFGFCSAQLQASGLVDELRRWALDDHRPMLGICVGMQLLADASEESPEAKGLGWIGGAVQRIPDNASIRVPHVGWNTVQFDRACADYPAGSTADFYFDHSYAYQEPRHGNSVGSCAHGTQFNAIVQRDSIIAVQFHPEKSQSAGMRFLGGFLRH